MSKSIGIIVPVYNVERYLQQCINSIIAQSYKDWKLILVDDGSTDNSGVICDKYAASDDRIIVVHKKNGGLVSAWKRGIEELPNDIDYITFVDSDDWITKDFLVELDNKRQESQADIVVSRLCGIYSDGRTTLSTFPVKVKFYNRTEMEKELFPFLLYAGDFHKRGLPCSRCGKLIKKELMISNLKYVSEKTTYAEDLNITFPMFLDAQSIDMIENGSCLYMVRKNPDSMTRAYDRNMLDSINYVYNSLFRIIKEKNKVDVFKKQIFADYLAASVQYYKNELQNPNGISYGKKMIEQYVRNIKRLEKAIDQTYWKKYRKLNVVIINSMKNFNWFEKNIIMTALYFLKKYKMYNLKKKGQ